MKTLEQIAGIGDRGIRQRSSGDCSKKEGEEEWSDWMKEVGRRGMEVSWVIIGSVIGWMFDGRTSAGRWRVVVEKVDSVEAEEDEDSLLFVLEEDEELLEWTGPLTASLEADEDLAFSFGLSLLPSL